MFLDIGAGILLGLWLGPTTLTSTNISFGILFTLLPDFDLLIYFLLKKTKSFGIYSKPRDHRELFHYPLLYIVIGGLLVSLVYPKVIPLFVTATLVQFVHDSFGVGWGIPWLYPLSKKYYKFMYQYDLYRAGKPQKLVWIWSKQEQDKLTDVYGDPEWYKHTFQLVKYAPLWHLMEFTVFAVAIIVLLAR